MEKYPNSSASSNDNTKIEHRYFPPTNCRHYFNCILHAFISKLSCIIMFSPALPVFSSLFNAFLASLNASYDRIHAPNSRVNISFCWLDYKEKNPDGYEKSQFYEYYQRFVQENYGGTKISMAVNRKPGEKMYIDWVGDQPVLLTDVTTGEIMRVHIFATILIDIYHHLSVLLEI